MTRIATVSCLALVGAALSLAALLPARVAAADEPASAEASPFAGKIVLVVLGANQSPNGSTYLLNARVGHIAGRSFVVGNTLDVETGRPLGGVAEWIAMDTVQRITLFDDYQTLRLQMSR